ncbi:hypothetical protein [Parendozoicomonas haliclonae]|uniref:Cytochrome c n=1 Tax=Parendozoicomonas haliclonae TaxID=1960125 RepID=A0A1X7ADP9_9GAMM|nr:hypothetical protein [Parendozoicomonas haliclonae]SMA32305.1 Cytochrome c [Parendozoicomonas haliclonae]
MHRIAVWAGAAALLAGCKLPGSFPEQEHICTFDGAREQERTASAANVSTPIINTAEVNGIVYNIALGQIPVIAPGDTVTLTGSGLGAGPDIDFTKIMIGKSRVLESDLTMFEQKLAIQDEVNYETTKVVDRWNKDILSWENSRVSFTVPVHVESGELALTLQIQKRDGYNSSYTRPGEPHNVIDAITRRIIGDFDHKCDVVSKLSEEPYGTSLTVQVNNPGFEELVREGREVFWSFDYNLGLAHQFRDLSWDAIFQYNSIDPVAGGSAWDLENLFGAYPNVPGQVPDEAIKPVHFDRYPMPSPIPGLLGTGPQKHSGMTTNTGWAGYRYAEAVDPYKGDGSWAGFNCASCHGNRITWERAPGDIVTKIVPGLPNPKWSMKWAILQHKDGLQTKTFEGIYTKEDGPAFMPGNKDVAKDLLIYHMPQGAGEHNMIRIVGEGSETDNDNQFSPIAIPNVTFYTGIRRSLSHTESYVGFEGSYIHSEEPDGAMGAMYAQPLKALTAYMTTLDQYDDELRNVGLYRWLRHKGLMPGDAPGSEGAFVQTGWQNIPSVSATVARGKQTYDKACASCHTDKVGLHTNEQMIPLSEVGRFFAPTIYQKNQQSIRVSFLRDIYWTQQRGLLSDGHVRNIEDLVNPQRCQEGSSLYNRYYTLHPALNDASKSFPDEIDPYPSLNRKGDVFRVPVPVIEKKNDIHQKRKRFIKRHRYFVRPDFDDQYFYWDFQKMRREWGQDEMGAPAPIGMPATPHPWCAEKAEDMNDLVTYLLTL